MTAETRPVSDVLMSLIDQVSLLVRQELRLARAETSEKTHEVTRGLVEVVGGVAVALVALIVLVQALVVAIANYMPAWLAALIVGVVLLATAGIAALVGKQRLQRATPPVPEEAVASTKADVEEIKERAHR